MDRIDDLAAFLAIVENGSQAAAARALRRSLQSVNRSLTTLERGVGVQLIRRTTRQSTPTEAGLAFYRRVQPAFAEIQAARRDAADLDVQPSGILRVAAPVLFTPAYMAPAACDYMARYPRVEIELKASDRPAELLAEDLDLAVRIRELADSGMKARRLAELRVVTYGAPGYFARHGRPDHPDDLPRHQCVVRITDRDADAWTFTIGGKRRSVRVRGRFRTDSTAAAHAAVACGMGIGVAPLWQIRDLVAAGTVEVILRPFEAPKVPIFAVWPPARRLPTRTRLFIELLAQRLKREQL